MTTGNTNGATTRARSKAPSTAKALDRATPQVADIRVDSVSRDPSHHTAVIYLIPAFFDVSAEELAKDLAVRLAPSPLLASALISNSDQYSGHCQVTVRCAGRSRP